jgi:hypothetical protein
MANAKNVALTEPGLMPVGTGLLRRSVLKLMSRALLVAILPVSPLPDVALIATEDIKIEQAETEREPVRWTVAMEDDLASRWYGFQSREDIAREMGISAGIVRVHATRLGLAARSKDMILSG